MALEFVIHLTTNNEMILKKIGEKINMMDETYLQQLNYVMQLENNKGFESEEEEDDKGARFYHIAKNLLNKKKKTWIEVQKINQKTLKNEAEMVKEEKIWQKKKSFRPKDFFKVSFILLLKIFS